MWDVIRSIPDIVKNWRESSDLLYQWLASFASALVVGSFVLQIHPAEMFEVAFQQIGWSSAANWFGPDAPPVLALGHPALQMALIQTTELLFLVMVLAPVRRTYVDRSCIEFESQGLLGARSAATLWVLLLVAAQQGSLDWVMQRWAKVGMLLSLVCIGVLVVVFIGRVVAVRVGMFGFVSEASQWFGRLAHRLAFAFGVGLMAFAFASLAPLLTALSWLCATESDQHYDSKVRVESQLAGSLRPTGAGSHDGSSRRTSGREG